MAGRKPIFNSKEQSENQSVVPMAEQGKNRVK